MRCRSRLGRRIIRGAPGGRGQQWHRLTFLTGWANCRRALRTGDRTWLGLGLGLGLGVGVGVGVGVG